MTATTESNPYESELRRLDLFGAQAMYGMVKEALIQGSMPPPEFLEWFALTAANRVAFFEQSMSRLKTKEAIDACSAHLNEAVQDTSQVLAILGKLSEFVLTDKVQQVLRARKLRLPLDYDSTYGHVLP